MATLSMNTVFPASSEICFDFESECIFRLPGFLFLRFIIVSHPKAQQDREFQILSYWADTLKGNQDNEHQSLLTYLQWNVQWPQIEPFINLDPNSRLHVAKMWQHKQASTNGYSIHIRCRKLPSELFRYSPFDKDRLLQLFRESNLYLPSPKQFNDPFDCSLDEATWLTFIECGMGCFSAKNNNILLFSHYADRHRGICFGVDPVKLALSLCNEADHVNADIRPIWYFNQMPPLDFMASPALCATCKHDVWSYEEEYRLFLSRHAKLLPSGTYAFSQDSLTSVIFGCCTSDECLSFVKAITSSHPTLKYFKAIRQPNRFGVELFEIAKL
jgi:hypothetical protein